MKFRGCRQVGGRVGKRRETGRKVRIGRAGGVKRVVSPVAQQEGKKEERTRDRMGQAERAV